jgi:putative membrane protein
MAARKRRLVTGIIHGEMASIVIIVLCAAIMARGGWV